MKPLQLCLSSRANQLLRWQQAFPQGRILSEIDQLTKYLNTAALVWIHTDCLKQGALPHVIKTLQNHEHVAHIAAISCVPTRHETLAALAAGASGYCHALATPELFQRVSAVIFHGGLWVGRDLLNQLADLVTANPESEETPPPLLQRLTLREQEVAQQVGKGASNKEIATSLQITERTVKAHLSAIFQKLEIRDRLHLVLLLSQSPS